MDRDSLKSLEQNKLNNKNFVFKIYYDVDEKYNSALLGDINNIIFPSIFNDYSYISAYGPYEDGECKLRYGDIVFDLGANIGMFSCIAAALGCQVHAFEPSPKTFKNYLLKNTMLYKNIVANNLAVLDYKGTTDFYVNDSYEESNNITRDSVHKDLEKSYSEITVQSTTVDAYVKENNLPTVNFIKSHTEYVEDRILDGAQHTLSAFSPTLAFYSQKALKIDRWKIIEKKILSANPNYVIRYKWRRMFAWVPDAPKRTMRAPVSSRKELLQ